MNQSVSQRADSKTTPSTTTASSGTTSDSKSTLRGKDHAAQEEMLATEPPKPPNITFAYNQATLYAMASSRDPVAQAVVTRLEQFEQSSTKDGVKLSAEQKLALAVQVMNEMGVSVDSQKIFLTRVFFGHAARNTVGVDQIHVVEQSGAGVTLRFSGDRGPLTPMTFGAPPVYSGKDDNLRGQRVEAAKNGFQAKSKGSQGDGKLVAPEKDSTFYVMRGEIRETFLASDKGKAFATMTSSERDASAEYHTAFDAYYYGLLQELVPKTVEMVFEALEDLKKADPAPSVAELVALVVSTTLGLNVADLFRKPHSEMRVDDEAVIELVLARFDIEANISSDDPTDLSRVVDKRGAKAPTEEATTEKALDPELVALADQNKLIAHLEAWQGRSEATHVGSDSAFYRGLAPNDGQKIWDERELITSTCVDRNQQIPTTHLGYFNALVSAWAAWEKDKAKGIAEPASSAVFDAAVEKYLKAPAQKGGVTLQ